MKITKDIRELTTTQANLAKAFGLTQPRINQLIDVGLVVRDETDPSGGVKIFESTKLYYSSKAASSDGDNTLDLIREKARHEKVKREISELNLRKAKSELYDAAEVEAAWIEAFTILRNNLLGLPSKFAVQLEHKSREEIFSILTAEIEDKLAELSILFD